MRGKCLVVVGGCGGESAEDWNSLRRVRPLVHGPAWAKLAVKSFFLLTDDPCDIEEGSQRRGHRVGGEGWLMMVEG